MKAEINNQNKEKLFALYWGQDIIYHSIESPFLGYFNSVDEEHMYNHGVDYYCLVLKSLSSISDEDAVKVAKFHGCTDKNSIEFMQGYGKMEVKEPSKLKPITIDFLRSKGYALPWMGLSLNEMIQAEWIKLI